MNLEQRLKAFIETGKSFRTVGELLLNQMEPIGLSKAEENLYNEAVQAPNFNPWFTTENIARALIALSAMLHEDKLTKWSNTYPQLQNFLDYKKKVAVVMAGNIPLVGFHDFVCILISGNAFYGKLSSQDKKLPIAAANILMEKEPHFADLIEFSDGILKGFDAIIATGSNNSARYFDYYFGKYPNIIRKNRTSVAVLWGTEEQTTLHSLGADIFSHFGLGCRNVSNIFVPENYNASNLQKMWDSWQGIAHNHKYYNNYEYFKAVFMINKVEHFDSGFFLLRKSAELSSPVSVLNFQTYHSSEELVNLLKHQQQNIQCVVSERELQGINTILPGQSQSPELWDYADGIDTMQFLLSL